MIIRLQIDDKRVFISHSSKDLDVGEAHNEFKDNLIKELRLPPVAN